MMHGLNIYGMFTAIKPELMGQKAIVLFWMDINHFLNSKGFNILYGRMSNVKSFQIAVTYLGAEEIGRVKMVQAGNELTLAFIRFTLKSMADYQALSGKLKVQPKL
jgi:hypothetical protein